MRKYLHIFFYAKRIFFYSFKKELHEKLHENFCYSFKKEFFTLKYFLLESSKGRRKKSLGEEKNSFSIKKYMQIFSHAIFLKE